LLSSHLMISTKSVENVGFILFVKREKEE